MPAGNMKMNGVLLTWDHCERNSTLRKVTVMFHDASSFSPQIARLQGVVLCGLKAV